MPVPFGVSVGDFVSGIQFIYSIIEAADATTGSVAQYQDVLAALQSSQDALQHLQTLSPTGPNKQAVTAILDRYRKTVIAFGLAISGYEKSFTSNPAKKWWRCLPKKVKWQRASIEKVQLFRSELHEHTQALLLISHCIERSRGHRLDSHTQTTNDLAALRDQVDKQAGLHRTNQTATERCLGEQHNLLTTISSNVERHLERQDDALEEQQSILTTLNTTVDNRLIHQDNILQRITAVVLKNQESLHDLRAALTLLFVCLMSMMNLMSRMLEAIPQRILTNGAVIFEDAHAFTYPIYTQFMDSWDASA
ncbi:hypothetical protein LTR78_002809 [Recurvomyces mirabilis]|uniref:Fungal N-terminal domain-containing protein n=1 Tax=Recurvomyces mirabilis TaxID=574656 RepID=A0AAE1C3Z6_9PEZI|nr:hypothetical protein LTR78_002809 [Recurvomyces mirabilis]KAK5159458.1 hypothetical protein LTS14_002600 [Recurvomyces mirabilis]